MHNSSKIWILSNYGESFKVDWVIIINSLLGISVIEDETLSFGGVVVAAAATGGSLLPPSPLPASFMLNG